MWDHVSTLNFYFISGVKVKNKKIEENIFFENLFNTTL